MLNKGLGLFGEAERPSPGPKHLGREVLSPTHGSGLFLGQWDVGCVMLCEEQCYDTCWPPHWVAAMHCCILSQFYLQALPCFSTLLSPWHFHIFTVVCPPSLAHL